VRKIKISNIYDKKKVSKSFQIPIEKRAKTAMSIAYPKEQD